jgi:hypothetical protein
MPCPRHEAKPASLSRKKPNVDACNAFHRKQVTAVSVLLSHHDQGFPSGCSENWRFCGNCTRIRVLAILEAFQFGSDSLGSMRSTSRVYHNLSASAEADGTMVTETECGDTNQLPWHHILYRLEVCKVSKTCLRG